jgi:hypothetical protein
MHIQQVTPLCYLIPVMLGGFGKRAVQAYTVLLVSPPRSATPGTTLWLTPPRAVALLRSVSSEYCQPLLISSKRLVFRVLSASLPQTALTI